ncbi:MAG: DNA-deoxyinosine glycosylase [Lautropia sp.]
MAVSPPTDTPPTDVAPAASPLIGLPPVHDRNARLLILGSFPGVASLAARAYYAHPRNQFWPILGALLEEPLAALPYADRVARVRSRGVAIWDVVDRCLRPGSLDASIREAVANDFTALLERSPRLAAVAFNGRRAARSAPWFAERGLATFALPSTSPAHAGLSFERKLAEWRVLEAVLRPDQPAASPQRSAPVASP